jgi:hypothetical protein
MRNPWSAYRKRIRVRREEWLPVLEAEAKKWSSMSYRQILSKLPDKYDGYQVEFEGKTYQVEVNLLENTASYIHLGISVDDGSLPASFKPVSLSFISHKANR